MSGGRISRSLPSAWADMIPGDAWRYMDMVMRSVPRGKMIKYLLDLPEVIWRRMSTGEKYDLIQCLNWMDIDHTSTTPIAPWYEHKSKSGEVTRFYLPTKQFENVTSREYILIDDLYESSARQWIQILNAV